MNISKTIRVVTVSALGFTLLVPSAAAQQPTKIDLSSETVGAEPKSRAKIACGRRRHLADRKRRREKRAGCRWEAMERRAVFRRSRR